jgi:Sulfotransferase family
MGILKYLKGAASNFHRQGDKPDIYIFATPRSGSTFLMELLAAQPGVKVYDEPLTVNYPESRRELGVETWEALTIMPDREERYRRFFDRLRHNKLKELNRPIYRRHGRLFTNRNVFKLVHGGKDMLPWFAETFGATIVVLIRHPIPTVLSHRVFPRLPYLLKQPAHRKLFTEREIAFAEDLIMRGSKFEQGMIDWSLEMGAMFRNLPAEATVISYEDLTVYPEQSFAWLQERLLLDPVGDIGTLIAQPSVSTDQSDEETQRFFVQSGPGADRTYLISRWQQRVSPEEVSRAFQICAVFDLRLYERGSLFPTDPYRPPILRQKESAAVLIGGGD